MDRAGVSKKTNETGLNDTGLPVADGQYSGPRHVFDLPQLYTKPSAAALLAILLQLELRLSSWDVDTTKSRASPLIDQDGVPSYLTKIISSRLEWIDNDEDKENIWESASKRLSERSGRTAMPSLSRTFNVPVSVPFQARTDQRTLNIQLYEPSLTGDNLGHKTWVASHLLAKGLPTLLPRHFPLIDSTCSRSIDPAASIPTSRDIRPKILELGAGTGLVGIAASGLFSVDMHLTDLAPIIPNLKHNIQQNQALAKSSASNVTAGELDWSEPSSHVDEEQKYDIILAADSLYAPEHSVWLVNTMANWLRKDAKSRIYAELPLRPDSSYPDDFRTKMHDTAFKVLEEGDDVGYDDWQDSSHEGLEVTCWWSVWSWGLASGVGD